MKKAKKYRCVDSIYEDASDGFAAMEKLIAIIEKETNIRIIDLGQIEDSGTGDFNFVILKESKRGKSYNDHIKSFEHKEEGPEKEKCSVCNSEIKNSSSVCKVQKGQFDPKCGLVGSIKSGIICSDCLSKSTTLLRSLRIKILKTPV